MGKKKRRKPKPNPIRVDTRVMTVIASNFGLSFEEISESKNLTTDLGGDSLDYVEMVLDLEEEFRIDLSDADVHPDKPGICRASSSRLKTVGDVIELIQSKGDSE